MSRVGGCVDMRVGAYAVRRVGITPMEHVCVLCSGEINPCGLKKRDKQSPPHRHLPPLCQFVTAQPSVAVASFNTEPLEEQRRKDGEEEKRRALTRAKALWVKRRQGQLEFITGQRHPI